MIQTIRKWIGIPFVILGLFVFGFGLIVINAEFASTLLKAYKEKTQELMNDYNRV